MGSGLDFPFPVPLADPVCAKTSRRIPGRRDSEEKKVNEKVSRKQILAPTPGTPAPRTKAIAEAAFWGWRSTPGSPEEKFALSITQDPPSPPGSPLAPPALGCRGCHAPHSPFGGTWGAANHPHQPLSQQRIQTPAQWWQELALVAGRERGKGNATGCGEIHTAG